MRFVLLAALLALFVGLPIAGMLYATRRRRPSPARAHPSLTSDTGVLTRTTFYRRHIPGGGSYTHQARHNGRQPKKGLPMDQQQQRDYAEEEANRRLLAEPDQLCTYYGHDAGALVVCGLPAGHEEGPGVRSAHVLVPATFADLARLFPEQAPPLGHADDPECCPSCKRILAQPHQQPEEAPVSPSPLTGIETQTVRITTTDGFAEVNPTTDGGVHIVGWLGDPETPPAMMTLDPAGAVLLAVTLLQFVGSPMSVWVPDQVPTRPMCPVTIQQEDGTVVTCEQTSHPLESGQACSGQLADGQPWEFRWNATPGAGNVPAPRMVAA